MAVAVLDKHKKPLDPCSEKRARKLLESGRARIHKYYPVFTIRLVDRDIKDSVVHPLSLGIDPGSRHTGMAVSIPNKGKAIALFQVDHRKDKIHLKMEKRKMYRKHRRYRKTRYRKQRFLNRVSKHRCKYSPSIKHLYESILNIINKLRKYFNIKKIYIEVAKFDINKMLAAQFLNDVDIRISSTELKEYLLKKYNYKCVYCGKSNTRLEIDHVIPRSRGGTNRLSNLVIACHDCNQKKSNKTLEEFIPNKANEIKNQLKRSLKDASAVNIIIPKLLQELNKLGIKIITTYGYITKDRRKTFNMPKSHSLDALCTTGMYFNNWNKLPTILITCMGRGHRRICKSNKYGFPVVYRQRCKSYFGFYTGDIVKAIITIGKKIGKYFGRIIVRKTGYFDIKNIIDGVPYKFFILLSRNDGYFYNLIIKQKLTTEDTNGDNGSSDSGSYNW